MVCDDINISNRTGIKTYTKSGKPSTCLASFADRYVVGFRDIGVDMALEVQNTKYSQILYSVVGVAAGQEAEEART